MTNEEIIATIKEYEETLSGILLRFIRTHNAIHIGPGDAQLLRQTVQELIDLFGSSRNQVGHSVGRAGVNAVSGAAGREFQAA